MKYVVILPDGCADEKISSLGNRTVFETARIPNMLAIARQGIVGWSNNTPLELPAASDIFDGRKIVSTFPSSRL